MQPPGPPRPFRGAQFDKDMFTFLRAGLDRDVLPESSRKRKLASSDYQMTVPNSNVRCGISEHQLNGSDSQGKRTLNSTPDLRSSDSSNLRGYPDQSQYWHQKNFAERRNRNERGFYESRSECTSFSMQLQALNDKVSSSYPISEGGTNETLNLPSPVIENFNEYDYLEPNSHVATHKEPNWAPLVTEDFRRCENRDSNAHVVTHKPLDWQPPVVQDSYQHEMRESNTVIVVPTSSNFQPSRTEDPFRHGSCDSNTHVTNHKASNGPPPVTQDLNHYENRESRAHGARVENSPHSQEFLGYSHQEPVQQRAITSDLYERASNILAELQMVPQNILNPRAVTGGLDEKGRHEGESYKVDCPSNIKDYGDVCRLAGVDSAESYNVVSSSNANRIETDSVSGIDRDKTSGNNTSTCVYNLQTETNNLLNVLKLLSAALPNNNDGKFQASGHDCKLMKSPPDSAIQSLNNPPQAETHLKKHEDGHDLGIPAEDVEKGSFKLDAECKLENGALTSAEKMWDGTLKLSTSVLVSVIAFFKSGEKIQDFTWSDSVEVKGKVRLEAFEKYVQDLPRSRSRGLMVMSLCWKEGSSNAGQKGMKEVAKKYKDQRKVGFAKLSSDVDLYICPHSDTIITILAKHDFCKGMTDVIDQNIPLIGCVVWKKNSSSAHSKHAEVSTAEKEQTSIGGIENNNKDKSPDFFPSPQAHQPAAQNRSTSDVGLNKPVLPTPSVASKTSATFSDDDDLPEYDFRAAISQASVGKASEIETPKPSSEGLTSNYLEQQSEVEMPRLPVQEQKPIEKGVESLTKNLFDDDDMPEWCPPDFIKKREEANKRAEASYSLSNPNVSKSGFADLTSGFLLPPPPPPPPLMQMQLQGKKHPPAPHVVPPPPPVTQPQLQGKSHLSAPHVLPPPPPVTQMQVQGKNNPSAHLPKPPAIGFKPKIPGAMSTQLFKDGNYPTATHRPPPPSANNFMHQSPVAVSSQMQFKEKNYTATPRVPPSSVDIPGANHFMHQSPAARSTQMLPGAKTYFLSPPAPLRDKPSSNGVNHENPSFPPGFTPNPAFRP